MEIGCRAGVKTETPTERIFKKPSSGLEAIGTAFFPAGKAPAQNASRAGGGGAAWGGGGDGEKEGTEPKKNVERMSLTNGLWLFDRRRQSRPSRVDG